MADMFVIVTIAPRLSLEENEERVGNVRVRTIIHAYGPYDSRNQAHYHAFKMRKADMEMYPNEEPAHFTVCKVLSDPPEGE